MKTVTFYRVDTGEITGSSSFHDNFLVTVPEGEACLQGEIESDRFYVVDGEPVEYPPRPHPAAVFDRPSGQWVDPRTLDQVRGEAKAKVVQWASATLSQFTVGYPKEEVLSWSAKLPAARRVLEGGHEPMIEIEAGALGITPLTLAAKVAEKGGQYEAIVALAAAIRGRTQAAIDAAPDAPAIDAALVAALAEATATLRSFSG